EEELTLRSGAVSPLPNFGCDVPFDKLRTPSAELVEASKRRGAAVQQWLQSSNGRGWGKGSAKS
ncbi:MAG TPA: hypothetical protein PKE45_18030, partial [Caldilineaceae bacterium]|nr:hypothetical protein [Caldilineaceae bacterium]